MRKIAEKELQKLVKEHPLAPWFKSTYGASLNALAAIIGEAGDVSKYKSVAALWKRFGLAVIDGQRQRRVSGADALLHGYAPARRSVMWNIGCQLIGCMGKGPRPTLGEDVSERDDLSPYQKIFIDRLRYEAGRDPTQAREPAERKGAIYESYSAHAASRAKRYVEKRFLRDLFAAWPRHKAA